MNNFKFINLTGFFGSILLTIFGMALGNLPLAVFGFLGVVWFE